MQPDLLARSSNPVRCAIPVRSIPDTWVTGYSEDIGNTFGPKRALKRFEPAGLVVEVSQVVVHEADGPDVVVGLVDSNLLAGEDRAEVDLALLVADATASRDRDGLVAQG
jgi:hypothetical protein